MKQRGATLRRPRRLLAVALLVALLSACGGSDDASELAEAAGAVSVSPTTTPTPTPSETPTETPEAVSGIEWRVPSEEDKPDQEGGEVFLEGVTPAFERAEGSADLATAFLEYLQARLDLGVAADVDAPRVGEWATGAAARSTISMVEGLRTRGQRLGGDAAIRFNEVVREARTTTIRGCMINLTTDRDAQGDPVENLTPYYTFSADLVENGGRWRVADFRTATSGPC